MVTPPGGIVTFLFTDVEGSTRLARKFGDARWAQLLEEHRGALRDAFVAHHGKEVDTQGDSFFVVFARPSDAVAAAIDVQHCLANHPWPDEERVRVRVGLHTGEALASDGRYVGHEVHRASRICDAGHGGQTLVSQATAELVRGSLPNGVVLTDVGRHRLKDLGEALQLFQLEAHGLAREFPRLRSLDVPHNLPAERSSFVGREDEIAALRRLLSEHRLATLTGIGGSGKTRLALRVGAQELGSFPDGVFFVDLSPVSEPDLVCQTAATACGLSLAAGPGGPGGSAEDLLIAALSRWKALLILDNCEHLIDEVARLVDGLLAGCPDLVFLATSREALGVEGEQIAPVRSLGISWDSSGGEAADALQLFVDRARAVKPGFQPGPDDRARVEEICRRLDGIPLAIEFAAARVAHMSPQQIAERLEDRFRLLTGGRRRVERQQTLSAALDWSHDLLEADERVLFRRLAVFAGDFSLDAAEAICGADDLASGAALDLFGSLVAKSLVTTVEDARGDVRFRLLETVRMYAANKLAEADESQLFRQRHRDWYLDWIESIPLERISFSEDSYAAAVREIDNIRAAADWSLAEDRPDLQSRIVTRLFRFWQDTRGTAEEGGRRCLDALRGEERLSVEQRVACHAVISSIGFAELEHELPTSQANLAIELAAGAVSPFVVIAHCTRAFASSVRAAFPGADPRHAEAARADMQAAHGIAGSGLPPEWKADVEWRGWMVEANLGDHEGAAAWAEASAATCDAIDGSDWLLSRATDALAVSHHLLGDTEAAALAARRARAVRRPGHASGIEHLMMTEVVPALVAAGEDEVATQLLREVGRSVRRSGVPLAANHLFTMVAIVDHLQGRHERAGRLLAAARYLGGAADLPIPFRTPGTMSFYRHYLPLVRSALGSDEARRARVEGRAMTVDEALVYALEGLGEGHRETSSLAVAPVR